MTWLILIPALACLFAFAVDTAAPPANTDRAEPEPDENTDSAPAESESGENNDPILGTEEDTAASAELKALADRAEALGMSEADLDDFKTPEALRAAVSLMERRNRNEKRTQQTAEKPPEKPKREAPKPRKLALELPDDEWSPGQKKALQALADQYGAAIDEMAAALYAEQERGDKAESYTQQLYFNDNIRELDRYVESLGDEFKKFVGTGEFADLDPNSEAFSIREAIWQEAQILSETFTKSGRRSSRRKILDRAYRNAFPEHFEQAERRKAELQRERRGRQALAKPGSSGNERQSEDEAGLEAVRGYLASAKAKAARNK